MDFRQLDPTELAQLQTHLQTLVDCACLQSNQSQQTTNLPMGPPSSLEHPPSILSPIPSVLPPTTMGNLIGLYQSVCISSVAQVPWGHPSQATIQMSAGPQPFLGQNSPAISMSDQVNQQWHWWAWYRGRTQYPSIFAFLVFPLWRWLTMMHGTDAKLHASCVSPRAQCSIFVKSLLLTTPLFGNV